jgi:hypothetical protein
MRPGLNGQKAEQALVPPLSCFRRNDASDLP